MKKFSLLLGAVGGAVAGYVFSNAKLREQLLQADNAEEVAHILGKHLQKDGQKVGDQVRELIHSKEVQENVSKAKEFVHRQVNDAKLKTKRQARRVVGKAKKGAKKIVLDAKKKVAKKIQKA